MNFSFAGKKVLITGAGNGMGRDLAETLHKNGATVYALDKDVERLKSLSAQFPGIKTIQCDLSSWTGIETALKDLETLDYLVNNAGIAIREPFLDSTEKVFDLEFNVNTKSYLLIGKLVANKMIKAGKKGAIVNMSSCSGIRANPAHIVYDMTKASVEMMTRGMAKQLGEHGIRVNCITPTLVLTEMGQSLWSHIAEDFRKKLPLQQLPQTKDIVNTVLFLLSDLSAMTTGASVPVDAGQLLL